VEVFNLLRNVRSHARSGEDSTPRRILVAAGPLFADRGLAEVTSKAIAAAAGVDLASINYHYGSRAGLYQAALIEAHRLLVGLDLLSRIAASPKSASEKLADLIEIFLDAAFAKQGWPARLLAKEVLSPSSHMKVLMTEEVQPKLQVVQRILSEVSGIPPDDPALLRSMISVAAPCLMLVVAGNGIGGPAQVVRSMPRADLATHLLTFALAGLREVSLSRSTAKSNLGHKDRIDPAARGSAGRPKRQLLAHGGARPPDQVSKDSSTSIAPLSE